MINGIMNKEKAQKIQKIYDWCRFIFILLFLLAVGIGISHAQTIEERLSALESAVNKTDTVNNYKPQLHGILRGKYEYEHDIDAGRFEVRNARISVEGNLPLRSGYKLEVDLCDETSIKMKDAWVRVNPWETLQISIGQQRLPFSIDAHRNPSDQYFANRSFIAKQTGDARDVGLLVGYTTPMAFIQGGKVIMNAGLFNGSNLDNQQNAWHSDWNYSARLQFIPIKGIALVPSIQHTAIANRKAHYTSFDFGTYYETDFFHFEVEYLRKHYNNNAFDDCNAINAMILYNKPIKNKSIESISLLGRYDYMDDHSDGKSGFEETDPTRLVISDYARHRMTLGITLAVRNKYFPTDLRFNYEKYWYPDNGKPKESEQDKLVAEIMIKF